MQATRSQIIEYLKKHGCGYIQDLASATGLTSMTIRHHLNVLEAEGFVRSEKERGHVGRPRHVYSLTDNALSLFPERYDEFAGRLLKGLKDLGARQEIARVLGQMADEITQSYATELAGKSLEERLQVLVDVLGEEGFLAAWEKQGDEYLLTEYSCPYILVGHEHPEICQVDQQVIATILDTPTEQQTCMLNGDSRCTFVVKYDFDIPLTGIRANKRDEGPR